MALVTNKPDCLAAERARAADIPVIAIEAKGQTYHDELLAATQQLAPDLICLMGYMKILQPAFCEAFSGKILNVHPSLLPKHAGGMGLAVHEAVLAAGEQETGMTIHIATAEVDAGPHICQKSMPIDPEDTPESVQEKVQALEKKWYPEVIRWFRDGKVVVGSI